MKLDLELKDDVIKSFVGIYNLALALQDDEIMEIFHKAMEQAAFDSCVYSLGKSVELILHL